MIFSSLLLLLPLVYCQHFTLESFVGTSWSPKVDLYFEPLRKSVRVVSNLTIPTLLYNETSDPFKIRIIVQDQVYILSVPLCQLQSARFQSTITAYLHGKSIYHVSLSVPSHECGLILKPRSGKFKTTLAISKIQFGSRPILNKMPEPEDPNIPQNQSIFVRYWYIIVPLAIFLFIPIGENK